MILLKNFSTKILSLSNSRASFWQGLLSLTCWAKAHSKGGKLLAVS